MPFSPDPETSLAVDPAALDRFITLYEKHYGIRLDHREASVKARRLLSLFRLIASHADANTDPALNPELALSSGRASNPRQGVLDSPPNDSIHTEPDPKEPDPEADAITNPKPPDPARPRHPDF